MKKLLSTFLVVVMLVSMVGCVTKDTDTSNTDIKAEEYQKSLETNAKVYKKYIKVPDYKGLDVEVDKTILEVTDEDVEEYINDVVESYATTEEITTGVTKKDDEISLDYAGKLDGVAFSGGTATDAENTVGSGGFIEDLDKGLIGLTVGKEYDIPCKFPDTYYNEDLAGKDVVFTVKVNAILKTVIPELTDEWVAANAEAMGTEEKTVEGLKKSSREYLVALAEAEYASAKFEAALKVIKEKITIDKYPQKELASLKATYKSNVESEYNNMKTYYSYLGINDFSGYLSSYYKCADDAAFDKLAEEQAKDYLLEKMIITIIAVDNKIEVTADEIKEIGEQYAVSYEMKSYDEMLSSFGNILNAELGYAVVSEKVLGIVNSDVSEKQIEKETETESSSAPTPASSENSTEASTK